MKETRKREFPLLYSKEKKLFNIVVHMSDDPGSMRAILEALEEKVNLIGTSCYTLSDGTAMFTAFAEALSQDETASTLKGALGSLDTALETEVGEGKGGLLVDTFHTGIQVGRDEYLLMRREGLSGVFDHIVKLFGSGGEVLLHEEGRALGRDDAQRRISELGEDVAANESAYLGRALTPQGWGVVESSAKPGQTDYKVTVADCFECSGEGGVRKGCDFVRGFYEGSVEVTRGREPKVEEVACRLRGDDACVFTIKV